MNRTKQITTIETKDYCVYRALEKMRVLCLILAVIALGIGKLRSSLDFPQYRLSPLSKTALAEISTVLTLWPPLSA